MDIIDLTKVRKEKEGDAAEEAALDELDLVRFDDEAMEMEEIVFLTRDGDVVVMTHPNENKGIYLTPEQSEALGQSLLKHGVLSSFMRIVAEEGL